MVREKGFGNREAALMFRHMAESVLKDDESLGDILIAGNSKVVGYKVIATEIDALDNLFCCRPSVVNATVRSGGGRPGSITDSATTAGEEALRLRTRVVIQVVDGEKDIDDGEGGSAMTFDAEGISCREDELNVEQIIRLDVRQASK